MKKRVAVISAILENAIEHQAEFNDVIAKFQKNIHGRMGIPFHQEGISVVSITMIGSMDEINSFTGKLGSIDFVQVKTAISKKEIEEVC